MLGVALPSIHPDLDDDELRDLVADKDKLLISRHGYRFGD